ncbi:MAG: CDP-diacylglycerol--glycerol-3-phosphate 3-phosphatidyltransferase [Erysipelotrichaceae bacterium]|nr:CDP-diacylglycerol--glycerol-3-phosphate 3-phosphatidyltransferase [Erysipelotrichaceae bacterium]
MNIANRLSIFRILLVPLIILIYIFPYAHFQIQVPVYSFGFISVPLTNFIILGLFLLASFTDFLDGYLARKYDLITSFGKFIDPIADKLLVNTMFLLFASSGLISIVPVLIMVARDTIVDGLRMSASSKGVVVAAGSLGKLKTVSQMLAIILLLVYNLPFELWRLPLDDFMLWFATAISIMSGISYFMQLKGVVTETM